MADAPKWSIPLLFAFITGSLVLAIGLVVGGSRVIHTAPEFPLSIDRQDTDARGARITQEGSGVVLSLRFDEEIPADLQDIFSMLLPPDRSAIAFALLDSEVRTLFGPDISVRYDLLPLLRDDGVLILEENAQFALMGNAPAETDVDTLLRRYRTSIVHALQQPEIITHTLPPRGIVSRTIRGGIDAVSERRVAIEGWNGTHLSLGGGGGIVTAQKGKGVLISSDLALAERMVRKSEEHRAARRAPGRIIMSGYMDRPLLMQFLQESPFLLEMLSPLVPAQQSLQWALSREGASILHIAITP